MIRTSGPSPRAGATTLPPVTLRAYLEGVYPLWHPNLEQSTLKSYGYAVTALERFAGYPVFLTDLDETLMLEFIRRRLSEVSRKSVRRERCDLLMLWRSAADLGYCRQPERIPVVQAPPSAPVSWTPDEYRKIIAACKAQPANAAWWVALMVFLYWTGARIGAALSLTWRDVDMRRGFATLRWRTAKTHYEQVVKLNPQAVQAIAAAKSPGSLLVFPLPFTGRRIWERLKAILKAAGLPDDREHMFHCCRKTCYTQTAIKAGLEAAGRQCGHRTDMSRYYLDVSQLAPVQAADILPRL